MRGLRASLRDGGQDTALLLGIGLNRGHEIGDEVGAALILRLDVSKGGFDPLILGWNGIDTARGQRQRNDDERQYAGRRTQEFCESSHSVPPLRVWSARAPRTGPD